MKVLFMGTPEFSVSSLNALLDSGHDVAAVVTRCDMPKGRGHKMQAPPVKIAALEKNLTVYQPDNLKEENFKEILFDVNPDIIVVVAYGKILPKYVLDYPRFGCINVHASLLPKYRGAAPIERSVIDGEKETGVTIMEMAEGLDTGDIIYTAKTDIIPIETSIELRQRLAVIGAKALITAIDMIEKGEAVKIPQDNSMATYANKIEKDTGFIDFNKSCIEVVNLIRGTMAYTYFDDKKLKLFSAKVISDKCSLPGALITATAGGLEIACKDGTILVSELQLEGSKRMDVKSYLLGRSFPDDTIFKSKEE